MAGSMDAVIIASHTKHHARDALPFVKAKIPIYLEKPLTDELEEAFDFVTAIGRDRRLIQIGLQRRYDPALLYTRKLIQSGMVGEIREIRCVLRDQFPPPPTDSSRGLIIDMGIHVADEAIFLLDEFPNEVRASVHHTRSYVSPIDEGGDTAFVTFTTPSGVLGRLDLSRTHSSGYNSETYIIGAEGSIHQEIPLKRIAAFIVCIEVRLKHSRDVAPYIGARDLVVRLNQAFADACREKRYLPGRCL
jgi:predicted dehydrogenase